MCLDCTTTTARTSFRPSPPAAPSRYPITTKYIVLTRPCDSLTSVGGTENIPETAVSFSSGGFSNYFSRPLYQEAAVTQYFEYLGDQNAGLYNPNGRGFPDVAAYAVAFDIIWDGYDVGVAGTSCASPTFASVVTLLNDELLAAGRPVLGFLNPWLYLVAAPALALTDITEGNNYACSNFTTGFNATVGWDPVCLLHVYCASPSFLTPSAGDGARNPRLREAKDSAWFVITIANLFGRLWVVRGVEKCNLAGRLMKCHLNGWRLNGKPGEVNARPIAVICHLTVFESAKRSPRRRRAQPCSARACGPAPTS